MPFSIKAHLFDRSFPLYTAGFFKKLDSNHSYWLLAFDSFEF